MCKEKIVQNAQYTFKYNLSLGRHGWLRLTPAYSVRLVEEILSGLDNLPKCVMEPFSGTGTTELVCASKGIPSFALEINPFLVWLGNTKLKNYSEDEIKEFLRIANELIEGIDSFAPSALPPIYNIHRWWGTQQADFLARIKSSIQMVCNVQIRQLLNIAFCRIIIELSNAAFNHVSTSFKESNDSCFSRELAKETYLSICKNIAQSAKIQLLVPTEVMMHDARTIPKKYLHTYDMVITSPPYPNRVSYIRELRPYMYWLDYLETS